MSSHRKHTSSNSIPIHFVDADETSGAEVEASEDFAAQESPLMITAEPEEELENGGETAAWAPKPDDPASAESIAGQAEIKRLRAELAEAMDAIARRQADFENYRKRIERERGEAYTRVVSDISRKLLPVLDNFDRALDAERSLQASESNEFRHFLNGVELISKQLGDVLESLGLESIPALGEPFNPHIHEAVVTEPSDEYPPDTVIAEMRKGYRIAGKLVRPAMVKVSMKSPDA